MFEMCEEFQNSVICSLLPDFLLDVDKTHLVSRQQKLERCCNLKSLIESQITKISQLDIQYSEREKKKHEAYDSLQREIENLKNNISNKEKEELLLRNKILDEKKAIDSNRLTKTDSNEVSALIKEIEILKDDISSKERNINHDLEQFKVGLSYYKKYLQCNIFYVPDHVIFTFNKSAKNSSEAGEFIKFKINDDATVFHYVEMHPKLKTEQMMVERLNETGDIQGFLLQFRKALQNCGY